MPYLAGHPGTGQGIRRRACAAAMGRTGPLVILVDGLDELTGTPETSRHFSRSKRCPILRTSWSLREPASGSADARPSGAHTTRRLALPPLEPGEVRAMVKDLGTTLAEADIERLVQASRGNPLYLPDSVDGLAIR